MTTLPPQKVAALKQLISEHLQCQDVYSQIRGFLNDFSDGGKGTKEEAINALKERGIVEQLIASLGRAQDAVQAAPPITSGDHRYLVLQVLRGSAFLDHLHHRDEAISPCRLYVSIAFQGQRFISSQVECCVEPAFKETFLIDLQRQALEGTSQPTSVERLLLSEEPVHIAVVRLGATGQQELVGTHPLSWRKVLVAGSVGCSVEVFGAGDESRVPAGVLQLRLELVPRPKETISQERVEAQLKDERSSDADSLARFIAYAKAWWKEFLEIRDSHRSRLIKVLARSETGDQRPVCTFVQSLTAGRLLGSALEAARFVSLMGYREMQSVGGERTELWSSVHSILARGHADREDHALLLCCLLLGFGLDAYVCIGKDVQGGHVWVVTRPSKQRAMFWESLTGRRYVQWEEASMRQCPYRTVGCVFNHRSFYANIQATDSAAMVVFDLENEAHWKAMDTVLIAPLRRLSPACLRPSMLRPAEEEERIERELQQLIALHRRKLGLGVAWDEQLSYLLMPALVAYENEAAIGVAPGNDEFQQSIKRNVPGGHTFRGYPHHFPHRNSEAMMACLVAEGISSEILATRGDQLRMAVRAKVFPYPEDISSVWVMVAVKFRSTEA